MKHTLRDGSNEGSQRKSLVNMMNVGRRVGVNISFPEHNSETFRNIVIMLGKIIEQVTAECHIQE